MSAAWLTVLAVVHFACGLVVVAEALNKLERTDLLAPGLMRRQRLAVVLKALAWGLLAVGGGWAVMTPLLHLERPTLQDVCVICGFAVLIIRTRVKEG